MLDISKLWLLFDVLSALFIVLNIYLMLRKKYMFTAYFAFLSIVLECLALLADYQQVLNKVINNDASYILDVIPSLSAMRTPIVITILFINSVILLFHLIMNFVSKHTSKKNS